MVQVVRTPGQTWRKSGLSKYREKDRKRTCAPPTHGRGAAHAPDCQGASMTACLQRLSLPLRSSLPRTLYLVNSPRILSWSCMVEGFAMIFDAWSTGMRAHGMILEFSASRTRRRRTCLIALSPSARPAGSAWRGLSTSVPKGGVSAINGHHGMKFGSDLVSELRELQEAVGST